jgi:aminoglycoside phosphotransferase
VRTTGRSLTEQGPAFSHGDPSNGNIFVDERGISVLINSGRGGSADRWLDIAYCV